MRFYATLPPGLEDVAAKELKKFGCKLRDLRKGKGRIFFNGRKEHIAELNVKSRILERIVILLKIKNFSKLDELYKIVKRIDFGFISKGCSFAIRSMRIGSHDFTSIDISRVVGQAVIDSYKMDYGVRLRVNLKKPDVIIRAEVVDNEFLLGVDTTGDVALHKRLWRVYDHPAHLNATIACGMIYLAKWKRNENLIDPMCGSGTIPIEAALIGRNIPPNKNRKFAFENIFDVECKKWHEFKNKRLKISGIERFITHINDAIRNAENAGVLDTLDFRRGDATKIKGCYDCIITNPPYGLRIASKRIVEKLYKDFLKNIRNCIHEKSRIVIITASFVLMEKIIQSIRGLKIKHKRDVMFGGLHTKIFLIVKS